MSSTQELPSLPLNTWLESKITFHLYTQVVGKVKLAMMPRVNHWWHVPLYVSARGITTRPIPCQFSNFEMEFDLTDHDLAIRTSQGEERRIPLGGAVSEFYDSVLSTLAKLGIDVHIVDTPFDPSRVKSTIPFSADDQHVAYDRDAVHRFWRMLVPVDSILREFRGRFIGKCSPVHLFWHSLDLAVTRFSGQSVEVAADADPVTREAYSHELISAGFWAGDDNIPEPAFYTYVYPEPPGLADEPLRPPAAHWENQNGGSMAILLYEDMRKSRDPRAALLDFLQSAYEAGAKRASWPRGKLEL